ncbi:Zn(2)-C6 fungal-type DNA-binding domain [Phaffia rhodozyma]|uniref:Zn(2)-C6 fungal-type DNA-binding domain n=1 Tax=Phaffia rhodozyma TaxID=264483 RepID=A0A0F7SS97_PHARH|nr:Zn(2)-C6 fungal-type DNA-binding domain [Phaffia rhodozyma]
MALQILLSTGSVLKFWSVVPYLALGIFLWWLRVFIDGTKNTWERDWKSRRVIVVGPPTPLVISLLDHLTTQNCQTLYLPPSLPPKLLLLLQAIQLRSSDHVQPKAYFAPQPEVGSDDDAEITTKPPITPEDTLEIDQILNAEPMNPKDYMDIMRFVKLWAGRKGGLGDDKRVDAIIWAYGVGEVIDPLLVTPSSYTGLSSPFSRPEANQTGMFASEKEEEKARFSFFTLFLPQILQSISASSRSVRLINLIHPLYPAGYKTSPLLHPTPSTSPTDSASRADSKSFSEAATRSHHAMRSIVFSAHFQRILDALALKGDAQGEVPDPEATGGHGSSFERPDDKPDQAEKNPSLEKEHKLSKKIERHSTIQVISVAPGFHFSSVLKPFLIRQSQGSLFVQVMWNVVLPFRLILGPSSHQAIQSVLFALCAPPKLSGWGSVIKDCKQVWVPPALRMDEKLGREVWEQMEADLAAELPGDMPPNSSQSLGMIGRSSCAECKRRKLRCDRQLPCNQCARRGCGGICPNGVLPPKNAIKGSVYEALEEKVKLLEATLIEHGISLPTGSSGPFAIKQQRSSGLSNNSSSSISGGIFNPDPSESNSTSTTTHIQTLPLTKPVGKDVDIERTWKKEGSDGDESDNDWIPALGTLELGAGGSARFVGATASSEWYNNQSLRNHPASSTHSETPLLIDRLSSSQSETTFSPSESSNHLSYVQIRNLLPSREEAQALVQFFYRHYAWNHNVITESNFSVYFDAFFPKFSPSSSDSSHVQPHPTNELYDSDTHPHKLALLFVVFAMGSHFNLEISPGSDNGSRRWYKLCLKSMGLRNCLEEHTVAGVQALHIMANYQLAVDRISGGDSSWPMWGMIARLTQAMGMHRDGQKWNLPPETIEERRRLFWETYTVEVFQANCFGRPGGMSAKHYEVEFPRELEPIPLNPPEMGFTEPPVGYMTRKFQLAIVSNEVLDQIMTIKPQSYSEIKALWQKIITFERSIPFWLRCRPALLATPSAYPDFKEATRCSPELNKSELKLTFQQHTHVLNICEAIMFLLRPYFARALQELPIDPSQNRYGEAYLAVVERCGVIIAIVTSIYSIYPQIAPRHWFFWYHASSAAVCMSSLIIAAPQSPLVAYAWQNLQTVCDLFAEPQQSRSTKASLALLLRLRQKAYDVLTSQQHPSAFSGIANPNGSDNSASGANELDKETSQEFANVLGLHTQLIERVHKGASRSWVIRQSGSSPGRERQRKTFQEPAYGGQSHTQREHAQHQQVETESNLSPPITNLAWNAQDTVSPVGNAPESHLHTTALASSHLLPTNGPPEDLRMDLTSFDSGTVGLLGALWSTSQDEVNYDWPSLSQQVDWDGISSTLGLGPLRPVQPQSAEPIITGDLEYNQILPHGGAPTTGPENVRANSAG